MIYRAVGKRLLDLVLAIILFLVLLPVFTVVLILLAKTHRGNPFFLQPRPGKSGEVFRIIKFKTMVDLRDENGHLLPDQQRLFGIGKWIRKFSLDEIPQLLNVIKGEMSLVGPRPLLVDYLVLYSERQSRRHEVKPGVTGWAQINGRNSISWNDKFEFDVWYVDHYSLLLDLKILVVTVWNVILGKGVTQQGHATVGRFNGLN